MSKDKLSQKTEQNNNNLCSKQDSDNQKKQADEAELESIEKEQSNLIAEAIDKFIVCVSDILFGAKTFIPVASAWQKTEFEKEYDKLSKHIELLENKEAPTKMLAIKNILDASYHINRLKKSELLRILTTSHFISLFTTFDAFTGDLFKAIYTKKPQLFKALNRTMSISDMLSYENLNDIKSIILQNEIESFRRKSYVEQFETLETRFSLSLKKFNNWPMFVECSQRRNILTHCDGIVSDQYIQICKKEGYELDPSLKAGDKLHIQPNYLFSSCNLMLEVGFKLGQTIWRQQFESELKESDRHLQAIQYEFLQRQEWEFARMAGEFAMNLPRHSGDVLKNIMIVNYAIALKFSGEIELAYEILDGKDWTALCLDFRLAESLIREKYDEASTIMKRIGKEGEIVTEHAYHIWPLFKEFRETELFLDAYQEIYGYPFVKELKRAADETKAKSEEEIEKLRHDSHDKHLEESHEKPNDPTSACYVASMIMW